MYNEKDSDAAPVTQVAHGEGSTSVLLGGLQKYAVYALQVLAFTQMGDGPPSSPILLRTKEDGRFSGSSLTPDLSFAHPSPLSHLSRFFFCPSEFCPPTAQTFIYNTSVCVCATRARARASNAAAIKLSAAALARLINKSHVRRQECKASTQQDFPHFPMKQELVWFCQRGSNTSCCLFVENTPRQKTHERILVPLLTLKQASEVEDPSKWPHVCH